MRASAEDFLSKPVDRSEPCVRVRNLLRLKAYEDFHDQPSQLPEMVVAARTSELTERTEALEAQATLLAAAEARTIFALRAARMGIWEFDVTSRKLSWSPTMAPLFGLTDEDAPHGTEEFLALVHFEDRALMRNSLSAVVEREGRHDTQFRAVWPDGSAASEARSRCICPAVAMMTKCESWKHRLTMVAGEEPKRSCW